MLDHRVADGGLGFRRQAAGGRGGCGNIKNKDQFAPPPAVMDPSHYKHSSASSANMGKEMVSSLAENMLDHQVADDRLGSRRQAAGGRGGCGNIVNKDQFAPPPAPMGASLEVETAANRVGGLPNGGRSRCLPTEGLRD